MNVPINKDFITEYKNDVWKGFTFDELKYIFGGVVVIAVAWSILFFFVGIAATTAIYISLPCGMPVVIAGFFKYQGYLKLPDLIKEMSFTKRTELLIYEGEDSEDRRIFTMKHRKRGGKRGV